MHFNFTNLFIEVFFEFDSNRHTTHEEVSEQLFCVFLCIVLTQFGTEFTAGRDIPGVVISVIGVTEFAVGNLSQLLVFLLKKKHDRTAPFLAFNLLTNRPYETMNVPWRLFRQQRDAHRYILRFFRVVRRNVNM